jgi:hypothetical protein
MTVFITLTLAGANVGPFNLYSNIDGFTTAFESGVSKAALLSGYSSSLVPDYTTTIRLVSTGECTNYFDIPIDLFPTTTSTSSSTTTTTTTLFPCVISELIINNDSLGSSIDSVSASGWPVAITIPVAAGNTATGTHGVTSNAISVDITPFDSGDNPSCLSLYVNSVLIQNITVTAGGTYTFDPYTININDCVWIVYNQGVCPS